MVWTTTDPHFLFNGLQGHLYAILELSEQLLLVASVLPVAHHHFFFYFLFLFSFFYPFRGFLSLVFFFCFLFSCFNNKLLKHTLKHTDYATACGQNQLIDFINKNKEAVWATIYG